MKDKVGIVGYGVYIPYKRVRTEVIVREREKRRPDLGDFIEKVRKGLLLNYKSVADFTEDVTTLATEASENALAMAGIKATDIGTVVLGSESKPYAVGLSARHVASFIGSGNNVYVADIEGACNSAMQGLAFIRDQILAGDIDYGLAIGSDIAQAPLGDPLEYACGAGAAALIAGKDGSIADIIDVAPYSSLTMDFWRREGVPVPSHFGKTTVDAYISHVTGAIRNLLEKNPKLRLTDFEAITFHQPSGYMPLKTARSLLEPEPAKFSKDVAERIRLTENDIEKKIRPWFKVLEIGNTYAASTPITLAAILDKAKPGDDVLAVSYGSGAYSIATWFKVTEEIEKKRNLTPSFDDYIARTREIELKTYQDHIRERLQQTKRWLLRARIIGEVVKLPGSSLEIQLCGCKRIYYSCRSKCLDFECQGPMESLSLPRYATLSSFEKLPITQRFTSNYELLKQGKVLIVDADLKDLKVGMRLELVIRLLDYEGRNGIIQYGPCYRPAFRNLK
ncbi:MAG: hydroxymethylglutaryl-CoA synthase [Candidatus Bathyarchaeia archaeon]